VSVQKGGTSHWHSVSPFEICDVPGIHTSMLKEPNLAITAQKLKMQLDMIEIAMNNETSFVE
jgi:hypothetical protein